MHERWPGPKELGRNITGILTLRVWLTIILHGEDMRKTRGVGSESVGLFRPFTPLASIGERTLSEWRLKAVVMAPVAHRGRRGFYGGYSKSCDR